MKPIQVEAGQHAPDVDELVEKAGSMIEKLEMDNSQIRNITGVEEAAMTHYWTNQNQPVDELDEVTNKGASGPTTVTHLDANPHQTGSTLSVHENSAGGDKMSAESSLRYGAGSSGVRKGPLDALMGGKPPMGKPPLPDMGGEGGDKPPLPGLDDEKGPPLPGMDDDDDDATTLGDRIKSLVEKLVDKAEGSEGGGKPPMPKPPMGGGPPGMGGPPPGLGGGGGPPPPI